MPLTHGSLFSGIGGFDLGFERAGIKTIWQVEIDDYCRRVLERHFPDAQRFGDIRECGKHNLPAVDIISGGFPCQDISNAGKRAGIDGERSGLWSEYARIIRELRPRFVVVENVAALLNRGMERVLGDLAACGYDAEWQSIRAQDVGAPHRRERIWIVAYPCGAGRQQKSRGAHADETTHERRSALQAYVLTSDGQGSGTEDVAHAASDLRRASGNAGPKPLNESSSILANAAGVYAQGCGSEQGQEQFGGSCWWAVEPNVGRVAHGVSARVDRLRGLGNAIVPQIAEWIGQCLIKTQT